MEGAQEKADPEALESLIRNVGGRGTTSDAEMVDWVYRKLSIYCKNSDDGRPMDQQIMGWMHVACHGHDRIDFYASELSRICRERDDLKIRLQRTADAHDSDGRKIAKMVAHIKDLESRQVKKPPQEHELVFQRLCETMDMLFKCAPFLDGRGKEAEAMASEIRELKRQTT